MSVSTILGINEVGENQVDKYITINDAIAALERVSHARYVNSTASADPVELTDSQSTRYAFYEMQAKTGAFDLVFESEPHGNNAQRLFIVYNNTSYACTIKASTGSGATVVLQPGTKALLQQIHEDVTSVLMSSGVSPYDIGFFMSGKPGDNAVVMKFAVTRAFTMEDDFAGSYGDVGVNPASSAAFTVRKNSSTIGTITVATDGTFTFATAGSGVETFAPGDIIDILGPTPQDAALEDVTVMLAGARLI